MWTYLIAPILSFLPRPWRQSIFGEVGFNWARATLLSGMAEAAVFGATLAWWYFHTMYKAVGEQMGPTIQAAQGAPGEGAAFAMGFAGLVMFAAHPLTWVLGYFAVEGVLRAVAAGVTDEARGTLPLAIVAWVAGGMTRRAYEKRVPLVADEVTRGGDKDDWALRVATCRPKPEWIFPLTIRYQDEFFQVAGQAPTGETQARPYVYLLNRPPAGEAYRGVREYDPDALLKTEEQPNFMVQYLREKAERWQLQRLPPAPDVVERSDGGQGWHLKIESRQDKPEWTVGRTIRFEEEMFRVQEKYRASAARPFGFRLRKLQENEAARGVIDYSPEQGTIVAE